MTDHPTLTIDRSELVAHLASCTKPIAGCQVCADAYGLEPYHPQEGTP